MSKTKLPSILLSAVPMGLGHMRAAEPIEEATRGQVMVASVIGTLEEKKMWLSMRNLYEFLSRITHTPFISFFALKILDKIQDVPEIKKGIDYSRPTFQVRILEEMIDRGLAREIVIRARKSKLPFVTTFYALAIAADRAGAEKVICIIPDSQVNRAWVAGNPKISHIIYCVPLKDTGDRLIAYGVMPERIHVTGFPLPEENIEHARQDLAGRLERLGKQKLPVRLTFSIGGAGAQTQMAISLVYAMSERMKQGKVIINLFAGVRQEAHQYFLEEIHKIGLGKLLEEGKITIYHESDFDVYFRSFNRTLRNTDILFTKPSELSFFTALGLPLALTPAIGPQEGYNAAWVYSVGGGVAWDKAIEKFDEYLSDGTFAKLAQSGYDNASRDGTKNIVEVIQKFS